MALKANLEVMLEGFKASKYWIIRFKKLNGIVDRKITKFVSAKYGNETEKKEDVAEAFVHGLQPEIDSYGPANVFNADQSGMEKETHSGRTSSYRGEFLVVLVDISSVSPCWIVYCNARLRA